MALKGRDNIKLAEKKKQIMLNDTEVSRKKSY